MRRGDLAVGAELYYCRSTKWMTSDNYGKAVVVAVEPYRNSHNETWGRTPVQPVKTTKGSGVLVDLFSADRRGDLAPKPIRQVVSLVALHGPWDETRAKVQEQLRAVDAVVNTRTRLRAELASMAEGLVTRAEQLGYRVDSREEYRHGSVLPPTRMIEIRLDEFGRMLERLEEKQ